MPKFFVPFALETEKSESAYSEIRANISSEHPQWEISVDRIFAVDHVLHDGKRLRSEVGKTDPRNAEIVFAIFRAIGGPFLVCTPSRGVAKPGPMLTNGAATLFDPE